MGQSCIICGTCERIPRSRVLDAMTGTEFSIVRCDSCGLGKTEPQPEDLAPYYPAAYYGGRHGATAGFCVRRRLRLLGSSKVLKFESSKVEGVGGVGSDQLSVISDQSDRKEKCSEAKGRLLDVGCGDGSFLVAAKAEGWEVTGVERFPDDARERGLEIFTDVCEFKLASVVSGRDGGSPSSGRSDRPPSFDCITLWHSLEHIKDPFTLLGQLSELLKPDGKVIVAVPDNGGWQARFFGRFWLHLDVPRHLWHFTLPALRGAFESAGLEVTRTYHQEFEYDLLGWSQSALNALFKTPNVFFNWLTHKPTCVSKPMLALHVVLGVGLMALALPLVWLGSFFRRGGTLVVVSRRSSLVR